jgi:predicted DNA-binding transcriptional regulator YafY
MKSRQRRSVSAVRALRLAQMAGDLKGRPMPSREALAQEFGVSPRTITRDFAALDDARIPYVRQDGHQ